MKRVTMYAEIADEDLALYDAINHMTFEEYVSTRLEGLPSPDGGEVTVNVLHIEIEEDF